MKKTRLNHRNQYQIQTKKEQIMDTKKKNILLPASHAHTVRTLCMFLFIKLHTREHTNIRCDNLPLSFTFKSTVAMVTYNFTEGETPIFLASSQLSIYGCTRLHWWAALFPISESSIEVNTNNEVGKSRLIHHSSCQTQLTLPCHEEEVLAGDESGRLMILAGLCECVRERERG